MKRIVVHNWKFWVDYKKNVREGSLRLQRLQRTAQTKLYIRKWKAILDNSKKFTKLDNKNRFNLIIK